MSACYTNLLTIGFYSILRYNSIDMAVNKHMAVNQYIIIYYNIHRHVNCHVILMTILICMTSKLKFTNISKIENYMKNVIKHAHQLSSFLFVSNDPHQFQKSR